MSTKTSQKLLQYRRASLRFPCNLEATCRAADELEACHAVVRDISTTGIGLNVGSRFPQGTHLIIQLEAEGKKFSLATEVNVLQVRSGGESGWYHGCQFIKPLEAKELEALLK